MKRSTTNILAGSIVVIGLVVWTIYGKTPGHNKNTVAQNPPANMHICSEQEFKNLDLKHNGVHVKTIPHDELLNMKGSSLAPDDRYKGDRRLPLEAITSAYPDTQSIEIFTCGPDNSVLTMSEISKHPGEYVLRQNRKGLLKLERYVDQQKHSQTMLRAIREIDLRS